MKTIFTISICLVLIYSCKKKEHVVTYKCSCTVNKTLYSYDTNPVYSNISKEEAIKKCNEEKEMQENLGVPEGYNKNKVDCVLN